MVSLVIGLGEVGQALFNLLSPVHKAFGLDLAKGIDDRPLWDVEVMHICIPYSDRFLYEVQRYVDQFKPTLCVVHSSTPIGTCSQITNTIVFHSPVRGTHPDMRRGLLNFIKYVSSDTASEEQLAQLFRYFKEAGIKAIRASSTRATEAMKLLELSRYGVYLAFAKEQEAICKKFGLSYDEVYLDFERTSNEGLRIEGRDHMQQPILTAFKNYIGGHCTLENMTLLLAQSETPLLREAYRIGRGTTIWPNCNVYPGAKIGKGCSIGQFTEIDDGVTIGNDVRVGAHCFIPAGVTIEEGCFIAPRVSFSNDKHPPSKKAFWGNILVKKKAVIGMGAIILPGVTIGERAVVGAGAIVTKDVPAGKLYYGVAARPRGDVSDVYEPAEALS